LISVFLLLFQAGVCGNPTVGTYGGTILPGTSESTTLTYLGQGTPEIPLSIDSNASPSPYYINLTTRTAVMQISFDALDTAHVAETMARLSRLADVLDIHRVGPNEEPVE
jgi:hypothetical protein